MAYNNKLALPTILAVLCMSYAIVSQLNEIFLSINSILFSCGLKNHSLIIFQAALSIPSEGYRKTTGGKDVGKVEENVPGSVLEMSLKVFQNKNATTTTLEGNKKDAAGQQCLHCGGFSASGCSYSCGSHGYQCYRCMTCHCECSNGGC
jgi:hypothetical protein